MMLFQERQLGDVLDFYDHQRIPLSSIERDTRQGGYRYYGAQGVIDYINEYIYDGQFILIAEDGANLVTRNEPIAFLVDGQFWVNNHAHVVKGKEGQAHDYYITALLNNLNIAGYITGAAQPKLSQQNLKIIKVSLPHYRIQCEIAELLSNYDNLIRNNRRRIALLEESARLLYQEWFVRLRFPGYEQTCISNGIPDGWVRNPLNELTSFLKRGITPTYDEHAEGLVINQKCIRNKKVNFDFARHQSKEVKAERLLQIGDVLVNSTGEGTLGRVAQLKIQSPNCTVDTHVTIVRPKENIAKHYFGLAVMDWEPRFSRMGKGATNQTELSPTAIGETQIMIPITSLLNQFELIVHPIYEQITNLETQNQKLRTARDLLLPRLMNGEISV